LFRRIAAAGPGAAARAGSGSLATTMIEQVDLLERWYGRFLPLANSALVCAPLLLAAVIWADWLAGAFLALAAPLIPLFMVLVGWGAEQASRNQQRELVRLGGAFLDRLRGLDTIRRFGAEAFETARLAQQIEAFRDRTLAVLKLAFLSTAVLEFFSTVAIAAVAIYVGLGLLGAVQFGPASALTLEAGLFVLLLAPEFFQPLRQLSQAWHDRSDGLAAAASIRALLEAPAARPDVSDGQTLPDTAAHGVEARALGLSRRGRGTILSNLSFSVSPGERVLLRGPSGCGKSTLLHLLAGFETPTEGQLFVSGIDIDTISATELARHRAWMGQQSGLFDGTLADNLRLADPDAADGTLNEALDQAGLSDWANGLSDGLGTRLSASGEGLSGGQARRLTLARCLVRPRGLLLLDEPTASLDADTAESLWRTLHRLSTARGATIICASHDPRAVAWADRTLAFENGRLIEVRS
jgi:ATP-binding cassette subfamily C protein CydD